VGRFESKALKDFWKCYDALTPELQQAADEAFALFEKDPGHPSLDFKPRGGKSDMYTARVSRGYRAACIVDGGLAIWFFVGTKKQLGRVADSY
jgi:hypothetical protein